MLTLLVVTHSLCLITFLDIDMDKILLKNFDISIRYCINNDLANIKHHFLVGCIPPRQVRSKLPGWIDVPREVCRVVKASSWRSSGLHLGSSLQESSHIQAAQGLSDLRMSSTYSNIGSIVINSAQTNFKSLNCSHHHNHQ